MKFREYITLKDSALEYSSHLAVLSAERHERDERVNDLRTQQLHNDVEKMGWRAYPMSGRWLENGTKETHERSLLVLAQDTTAESFVATVLAWLNKYEQEAALVRYAHNDDAWLLTASGNRYKQGSWEEDIAKFKRP